MFWGGFGPVLAALALASATDDGPPIVHTSYGSLEGKQVSVRGTTKPVYNYLAVPFAKPPVGSLRFSKPKPPDKWTGTRKATVFAPGCPQNSFLEDMLKDFMQIEVGEKNYNEDCLYLNVYTPVRPQDSETRHSVMVWIHGGGFWIGSGKFFDGSSLAAYEDVVVVVIQYRLGILGFLSAVDEHLPGNLGMLDQIAALEWVQKNIASFGGDPSSVTIFGESAGGVSVSLLFVSPLASGLFHRVISESGTALLRGIFNTDPKSTVQMIANKTNCTMDTSREIVSCLRNKSEEELLNFTNITFAPIVLDGIFLSKEVEQILEAKEFKVIPYMLGITNHEVSWLIAKLLNPPGWEDGMDRETSEKVINNTKFLTEEELQRALEEYMGDTQDKIEIRDRHLELMGDVFMLEPTIRAARFCRDAGVPVFLYEFQQRPSIYNTSRPAFVKADHGDEIGFVFGAAFWNGDIVILGNSTTEELALSRSMMAYWANFAKHGNPNGEGLEFWPAYDQKESYMQLNLKPEVGTKLKEHRMKFFTDTLKHDVWKQTHQNLTGGDRGCPTVSTEDGWLRGKQMEVEGGPRPVFGYLGIPFAAPPVGPLRFAAPQRPRPWTGIRNATDHPPMCLQMVRGTLFSVPASEDCLYLSVYSPVCVTHHATSIPVMVWIHGGAFILGRSSIFYGSALASFGNVVVVVIQYRLSVAGFLSTGDEWARGNFGFLDQVAALQWVQRNIGQFGGDPDRVTLFGESVGGLSVSLHTLSPLSAGLFHKAILQSGSTMMPGLLPPQPSQLAKEAAEVAGCDATHSQLLLQCLRNKTEEEMSRIVNRVNDLYQLIPIVVDGYFLPDDPQKMFQDGIFQKMPYLLGVTTEEGVKSLVHSEVIIKADWEAGITRDEIREKINMYLNPLFGAENGELIFDEYFMDVHDPELLKERYLDLFGDVFITIPTLRAAQYYRDAGNPVFLYEFQHRASFYERRIPQFTRAPHGAELSFVFGGPFIRDFDVLLGNMSEEEKKLSETVMLYWAKFAWNGNPNLNKLPLWPMYGDHGEYLQLNLTLQVGCGLKRDKLQFWADKPARKVEKVLI